MKRRQFLLGPAIAAVPFVAAAKPVYELGTPEDEFGVHAWDQKVGDEIAPLTYDLIFRESGLQCLKRLTFTPCYLAMHGFGSERYWADVARHVDLMQRDAKKSFESFRLEADQQVKR